MLRRPPVRTISFNWESQVDFAFFCNANAAQFDFGRCEAGGRGYWMVRDQTADVLLVREQTSDYATVHADKTHDSLLLSLIEEWEWRGRPAITDYRVEVAEPEASQPGKNEWIDRRSNVALRLSLAG